MLEQQRLRNTRSGRHALGRGAGVAVTGKAPLGGTKNKLPPQVASHAKRCHRSVALILLERDDCKTNRHRAQGCCLTMIFSENRYTLFRIILTSVPSPNDETYGTRRTANE